MIFVESWQNAPLDVVDGELGLWQDGLRSGVRLGGLSDFNSSGFPNGEGTREHIVSFRASMVQLQRPLPVSDVVDVTAIESICVESSRRGPRVCVIARMLCNITAKLSKLVSAQTYYYSLSF